MKHKCDSIRFEGKAFDLLLLFAYTNTMTASLAVSRPISPWLEMGAYEYLWTEAKQSFKRLADLFRAEDALPSDFVLPMMAERCAREATEILRQSNVERFGIRLARAGEYPNRLLDAKNPVELLYFQGWWDLVDTPCIAIVGTRKPSKESLTQTVQLTRLLVRDGYTIVSGLAAGIDSVAHKTAIQAGGLTIAAIGTPLSQSYPRENTELQRLIAGDYLLVSQVPVIRHSRQDWRHNRAFFPQRNITMSALSLATIIIEASDTSGTLMQARAAIQQKRPLFILDGCFRNPSLTWPRRFEEMGAIRITNYEDVKKALATTSPANR